MTTKSSILILLIGAGIVSSCGTSKKLDTANAQIADLQTTNAELTSRNVELTNSINTLNKQVSDLSAQNQSLNTQFASYKKECQSNIEDLKAYEEAFDELSEKFCQVRGKGRTGY